MIRALTIFETDCGCSRPPMVPPLWTRRRRGSPDWMPASSTQASIAFTASLLWARGTATVCGLRELVFDLARLMFLDVTAHGVGVRLNRTQMQTKHVSDADDADELAVGDDR